MRVGIDARMMVSTRGSISGVSQFTTKIIEAMERVSQDELVLFSNRRSRIPLFSNHLVFARQIDRQKLDIFFSPSGLLPLGLKTPAAVFIHDLIILKHPEWFPDSACQRLLTLHLTLPSTLRNARRILVPSTVVAHDVAHFFPHASDRVEVVPEGVEVPSVIEDLTDEQRQRWGIKGRYIFMLGTLEPRKNFETAIHAFPQLHRTDLQLVIAGARGWGGASVLQAVDEANRRLSRDAIRYLGPLHEQEKWMLYKEAEVFLAPSYDEGFYLPPFEALAVGTPVVVSSVGAVPDLLRGVELIKGSSPDQIAASLRAVLDNPARGAEILAQTQKVVAHLCWDQAARQILAFLRIA